MPQIYTKMIKHSSVDTIVHKYTLFMIADYTTFNLYFLPPLAKVFISLQHMNGSTFDIIQPLPRYVKKNGFAKFSNTIVTNSVGWGLRGQPKNNLLIF